MFAAFALADVQRNEARGEPPRGVRWVWIVPAVSWLVAGVAIALRQPDWQPAWLEDQLSSPRWIVLGPIVFTICAALFAAAAHGRRAALYGLVLLALAEHAVYAVTLWWSDYPLTLDQYRATIAEPPVVAPFRLALTNPSGVFITHSGYPRFWASTSLIVRDSRLVTGYAGLMPAQQLDYSKPASLRVAGARALVVVRRFVPLSGALPRARLVASAQRSAQPALDIELIDVEQTALVEEPVELEPGPAGDAAIEEDLPGAIRIAVHAPTRQLLVISESFHAGWRAELDGAPARALRVDGDFLGVVVDRGSHDVQLRFAPQSFTVGCWTSLAGIAIVLAVALAGLAGWLQRSP